MRIPSCSVSGGCSTIVALEMTMTPTMSTVFDSSEKHGGAQPFIMDQVFPGFAEAMTRMQEGGQYRFSMPQRLAFTSGAPPGWPKDSDLTFEVRVQQIARGGAALMQQMQAQQQQQPSAPQP